MRRALTVLALFALLAPLAAGAETYGGGVTLAETTSIGKILAEPDAWVGKHVRVEGEITDVCPMKGCWMEISEPEGDRIRIKVADGVMVFPVEGKGKRAVAEGVVEAIPMNREQYVGYLGHLAEEKGEKFDPATVTGEGPFKILQLRGLGAQIGEKAP
jgi:hypothetical protein